jgi:hypothetical protein
LGGYCHRHQDQQDPDERPESTEVVRSEDARGDHAQQEGGSVTDQSGNTDEDQALGER